MSVEDTGAKQETLRETMERVMAEKQADAPVDASPEQSAPTEPAIADTVEVDAAPEPEAAEPGGDTDGASPEDAPASEHAEPPAFEPPQHWSKEDKDRFLALPDDAKEFVQQRAKDLEQRARAKMFEADRLGRDNASLAKAIEPFKEQIARSGATPEQALTQLAAFYAQLQTEPAAALAQMAKLYASPSAAEGTRRAVLQQVASAVGLQPDALLDEPLQDLDPTEAKLTAEFRAQIQALESKIDQLTGGFQQTQEQTVQQQIDAFKTATGSDGKPLHPHFDTLQREIAGVIQGGLTNDLGDAYKMALRMRPDLQPTKPATVRRRTETSVAKSSPTPGNGVIAPPKNLHDHIRQVADRIRSA